MRIVMATLALALALSLVAWRQGRALEALAELDRVRQERTLARAQRASLERAVQQLESRGRVTAEAQRRLGMRMAAAADMVILEGEDR